MRKSRYSTNTTRASTSHDAPSASTPVFTSSTSNSYNLDIVELSAFSRDLLNTKANYTNGSAPWLLGRRQLLVSMRLSKLVSSEAYAPPLIIWLTISAERQRKKLQADANAIFGKGRRSSAPGAGGIRKPGAGPSIASRIGTAAKVHYKLLFHMHNSYM